MPFRRGIMTSGFLGLVSDAPTGLSATSGANTQSVLAWTAPANNGGSAITDYVVQYSTDNTNWTTFSHGVSSSPGITVTGLGNGPLYYFRVAAITAYGTGAYLGTTATPYTVPSAPAKPTLSAGTTTNTTDTFTWTAPANNGSAISTYGYQVSANNGGSWGTEVVSNVLTYAFNTLVAPTTQYSLRVRGFNSAGWGDYSIISDQTTAWSPNAGTETQGPQTKATASDSVSQTDNDCSHSGANCSDSFPAWCECGQMFRTGTRTASRTRTRTRTNSASRYRSRSTNFYSRSGNSNTSTQATGSFNIGDAEWNLNTTGTTGYVADSPGPWSIADAEWSLGSASGTEGWTGWSNGAWSHGPYGACNQEGTVEGKTGNFSQGGLTYSYSGPAGQYSIYPHPFCSAGECDWSVAYFTVTVCNETGTNTITYQNADVCRNVFGDPC